MAKIAIFDFSNSTFNFNFSWQNHQNDLEWLCHDRIENFKKVYEWHKVERSIPIQYRYGSQCQQIKDKDFYYYYKKK